MQRKLIYFIDSFLTLSEIATCYKLFKLCYSVTFCCFLVTNSFWLLPTLEPEIVRYLLWSGSFQNSSQTLHLVIKVEFENCSLQLHILQQVLYIILFWDFIQDHRPPAHCQGTIKDPEKISTPLNLGTPEFPPTPTVNQVQFTIMFKR